MTGVSHFPHVADFEIKNRYVFVSWKGRRVRTGLGLTIAAVVPRIAPRALKNEAKTVQTGLF